METWASAGNMHPQYVHTYRVRYDSKFVALPTAMQEAGTHQTPNPKPQTPNPKPRNLNPSAMQAAGMRLQQK